MKKRKQKPVAVEIQLHVTPAAQEFFLRHEQQFIAREILQRAMRLRDWRIGKSYETGVERGGQHFKVACDNRRDGIHVLIGRAHEMIHEDVPA